MKGSFTTLIKSVAICVLLTLGNTVFAQLTGWNYTAPITITENSGSSLTDHQVVVSFDSQSLIAAGKMKSDGSDIRVATNMTGDTLLDFWLESGINTTNTRLWLKAPSVAASGSKTYYLFYGNSSATDVSNVANTYIRQISNLQYSGSMNENTGTIMNDGSGNN
ncbi:MAG: DUF2341 domain-containing protein, partial [Flavobacteriales bacterium]|nr:DUF2341 domain-containing protein [Flavobacteriales bacterium]